MLKIIIPLVSLLYCLPIPLLEAVDTTSPAHDTVTQVSTINALLDGLYDGTVTVRDMKAYGDIGIGTIQGVDGELIVIDGAFFVAKADGVTYPATDDTTIPFMSITQFVPDRVVTIPSVSNLQALSAFVDAQVPEVNMPCTIRIEGTFTALKVRSLPRQEKPYRPLKDVIATDQKQFEFENIAGSMIGFRCPTYLSGVNVPGYHFHFISSDRRVGGHVLEAQAGGVTVAIDMAHAVLLKLPDDRAFMTRDLSGGREKELTTVERGR